MIGFFRRIRKKLADDNQFLKYSRYAIGEIVLVMVGILLALQVNNWNEKRKARVIEIQLLLQLREDLEKNLNDLKFNQRLHLEKEQDISMLLQHMDSNLPYNDSLSVSLSSAFIWTKLVVNGGAYQTIQSKGVDIITNIELRKKIFSLYEGELYWLQGFEKTIVDYIEDFRHHKAQDYFQKLNVFTAVNSEGSIKGQAIPYDYESLRKDKIFKLHLDALRSDNRLMLYHWVRKYIERTATAIDMIDAELNDLE